MVENDVEKCTVNLQAAAAVIHESEFSEPVHGEVDT